ncbi:PAS domain-containing hybrid sensor histidine kinase/response regulator [Massilia putida]|uniref:PAS domain-containing hybrid sensor histidine kinase/response regulator n=1 Tax=Massilia putida TaxID=1141883 RepID=UPI000950F475|nr:ATP-binding protein [Massilia putida]
MSAGPVIPTDLAADATPDYRALFDAIPTPCLVLTPDFTIVAANEAYLRVSLKERVEIIGSALFEVFPDNPDDPTADGTANLRASLERVLRTRRADTMAVQKYDIQVSGPEGPRYEARYWSPINSPVFDAAGKLTHIIQRVEEVTEFALTQQRIERMESEIASQALEIQIANRRLWEANEDLEQRVAARTEQLYNSERQARDATKRVERERALLEAVLEAAPVAIAVADADGSVVQANPEFVRLWGNQSPLPYLPSEYGHWNGWWADGSTRNGQRVQIHEWPGMRALAGENALRELIEIEPFDQPSQRRITINSGAPIRDTAGNISGAVISLVDVTEGIKAQQALQQADRRKDEFLAMLAHELRNPLAPIGAAADLLAMGRFDEEGVRRTCAVIARQVRHMSALLEDLLDVSRVTRGLVTLSQERVDVRRVVDDALEQVRPIFEARRHQLEVCLTPQSALTLGDHKRLVQILTNLLNNAAKYTASGGHVKVELNVDAENVLMSVIDNGVGMSPELTARAFDLFTQGKRTADRAQGGLGIGLALVKTLVELHDGAVTAESDGECKGSRFTVRLPRLLDESAVAAAPPPCSVNQGLALDVLIVDDNVDAAEMLAMLVKMIGHRVHVENGSHEALARARSAPPDVCLLDIGLPIMDGNELARNLRANPATAGAVLVAITGYGQEQDLQKALESGFDHHFVKPIEYERLAELLGNISVSVT